MTAEAPAFRPDRPARFAPGWLGDDRGASQGGAALRVERQPDGVERITARPTGEAETRSVVLIPSARGFTAMYTELCLRLAQRHHWSIASTELFPGQSEMDDAARSAAIGQLDDSTVLERLDSAAESLGSSHAALVGFCVGGMYAYKASARALFDRVVAFYGMVRLQPDWQRSGQEEPLSCLARRTAEVLAIVGGRDQLVPAEDVDQLGMHRVRTHVYPEAGHAFAHDPALPGFRQTDAEAAWRSAVEFISVSRTQRRD